MERLSDVILQIYRAAREQPIDEFQDFVLGIVQSIIPFDSCGWATGAIEGNKGVARFAHLLNEPDDLVRNWEAVSHQDHFNDMLVRNLGRAIAIHAPTFFADPELADVRDHMRRYGHANCLGVAVQASLPRHWDALYLWRTQPERHYNDAERDRLERLMPHLTEALAHNRMLALKASGMDGSPEHAAIAIARGNGLLAYASSSFIRLMQTEWPVWTGHRLPEILHARLLRPDASGFQGDAVAVTVSRLGELMFLRAGRQDVLQRLTMREAAVAQLYGDGLAHKEIAKRLEISPATVRVFLRRVYGKLRITNKAQLAVLLERHCSPGKAA